MRTICKFAEPAGCSIRGASNNLLEDCVAAPKTSASQQLSRKYIHWVEFTVPSAIGAGRRTNPCVHHTFCLMAVSVQGSVYRASTANSASSVRDNALSQHTQRVCSIIPYMHSSNAVVTGVSRARRCPDVQANCQANCQRFKAQGASQHRAKSRKKLRSFNLVGMSIRLGPFEAIEIILLGTPEVLVACCGVRWRQVAWLSQSHAVPCHFHI